MTTIVARDTEATSLASIAGRGVGTGGTGLRYLSQMASRDEEYVNDTRLPMLCARITVLLRVIVVANGVSVWLRVGSATAHGTTIKLGSTTTEHANVRVHIRKSMEV
jgi:hypothetical protein